MGIVVYFSSATGNTRRFVERAWPPGRADPLRPKDERCACAGSTC